MKWKQTGGIHKSSFFFWRRRGLWTSSEVKFMLLPGWRVDNWCFRGADSSPNGWHWETTVGEEASRFTGGGRKKVTGEWRGRTRGRAEREGTPFTTPQLIWLQGGAGSKNERWNRLLGVTEDSSQVNAEFCPASVGLRGDVNSLLVILQDK